MCAARSCAADNLLGNPPSSDPTASQQPHRLLHFHRLATLNATSHHRQPHHHDFFGKTIVIVSTGCVTVVVVFVIVIQPHLSNHDLISFHPAHESEAVLSSSARSTSVVLDLCSSLALLLPNSVPTEATEVRASMAHRGNVFVGCLVLQHLLVSMVSGSLWFRSFLLDYSNLARLPLNNKARTTQKTSKEMRKDILPFADK
jgi:hypothetical protein